MDLTERHDLHSGDPHWNDAEAPPSADPLPDRKVDIAIIGAGVMGAMLVERLAAGGARVALLDRRPPAHGSTAASTALVMWEMDVPLTALAEQVGMNDAAGRWRRVYDAVRGLHARIAAEGIDCGAAERPVVYLEGALLPGDQLAREAETRQAAGLPSTWHDADAVADRFGIAPCPAIVSDNGFGVDPVRLTLAMLARAKAAGATISYSCDVQGLETEDRALCLRTSVGDLHADRVILATGYERARAFLPPAFELLSSYAIATPPGTAPLWRENAMIWQAADPYLYTRTDAEGRIVAGGEDEDFSNTARRDALIGTKAGTIAEKLGALLGRPPLTLDRRWAATFGASPDGLPAIGRARNHERLWLASGFGGNGVSFAALAAEALAAEFGGGRDDCAAAFDPYRFDS